MIRRFIIMVMVLTFTVLSTAYAAPNRTVDVLSDQYDRGAAIPFDAVHVKGIAKGEDWYVVPEDFGMLHIETDAQMQNPVQNWDQTKASATYIELGHLAATNMIMALYGVEEINIHPGQTYFGAPSKFPNGAMVINDVSFVHSGLLWKGRVVVYTSDMNDSTKDAMFLYPVTR